MKFGCAFARPVENEVHDIADHRFFEFGVCIERIVLIEQAARHIGKFIIEEFGKFDREISLFAVLLFIESAVFVVESKARERNDDVAESYFG